jgi:hypothetical protein
MDRAIALDPGFASGIVVPALREACTLPASITGPNPLYADQCDDRQSDPWTLMLQQCGAAGLGTTAPVWLAARDEMARYLERNQSVNLVVDNGVNWRALLEHLVNDYPLGLARVDLEDPDTTSRRGLLATIAKALGERVSLSDKPRDLADFKALLHTAPGLDADLRADLVKDVESASTEIAAPTPNTGRLTRWLGGIGAAVQTVGALQPAWEAVKVGLRSLGLPF